MARVHPNRHALPSRTPRPPSGRLAFCSAGARRWPWPIRTFPVSLSLLVTISIAGIAMGAIGHERFESVKEALGFDLQALKHGRLYVLPLGPLVQDRPGFPWKIVLLVLPFTPTLEYLARSWRTAFTFFATDFISTVSATLLLWGLAGLGSPGAEQYIREPDLGSSSAAFGCAAAAAAMLPGRSRLAAAGLLAAYLVPSLYLVQHVYAVEHVISAVIGFGLGLLWHRGLRRQVPRGLEPDSRLKGP